MRQKITPPTPVQYVPQEDKNIQVTEEQFDEPQSIDEHDQPLEKKRLILPVPHFKLPLRTLLRKIHLPLKTSIGLVIAVVVLIFLLAGAVFIKNDQKNTHNQQVFDQYYPEAKRQFDSANAVAGVNASSPSIQSEYQKANKLLKTAQQQLIPGTTQAKQVNDLLAQVEAKLQAGNNVQQVILSDASASDSQLLATEQQQANTKYVTTDGTTNYYITDKGIFKQNSSNALLSNQNDWSQIGGFSTYLGNFYVLDKKHGILKYISASNGYNKATYFAYGVSPDLSQATSMAIDSSIYILYSTGAITKYTKGEPDTFSLKNFNSGFSSPTRIVTNTDMNNIYVLDNGNSRIVQIAKDGTFESQYVNDAFHTAKDIDVQEANKKIYILTSSNEIKSIAMQ